MKRYLAAGAIAATILAAFLHPPVPSRAVLQLQTPPVSEAARVRRSLAAQIVVYVAGAVQKPGLYRLAPGSRGIDAVRAAGGLKAQADPTAVNLAEQLEDGEQITAPLVGERIAHRRSVKPHRHRAKLRKHAADAMPAGAQIDLNAADAQTLSQLPGIGEELARRLVAFRAANGPFVSLDELADVAGMTPRLIDAITPYLTIGR